MQKKYHSIAKYCNALKCYCVGLMSQQTDYFLLLYSGIVLSNPHQVFLKKKVHVWPAMRHKRRVNPQRTWHAQTMAENVEE